LTLVKEQLSLGFAYKTRSEAELRDAAAAENKSLPVHRWVPWIAGFSAQFVEDAIKAYLPKLHGQRHLVLDPFAGVGTTLVEAVKAGYDTIGYEINPFAALAANAKLKCLDANPDDLGAEVQAFRSALSRFEAEVDRRWLEGGEQGLQELLASLRHMRPSSFRSRISFFSPPVEAKFLYALLRASSLLEPDRTLFRLALGATMVTFSNYSYEPSLASRPGSGKPLVDNASVMLPVCRKLAEMLEDIEWVRQQYGARWLAQRREVIKGSYFESSLRGGSVSLVITSPPYMNNYHYVRNTRPQLHWLGLLETGDSLNQYEEQSYGKFWQTVRDADELPLALEHRGLEGVLKQLRDTRRSAGAYGGPGWANYVTAYFNDCDRFMGALKRLMRRNGVGVIVVGNSIIQGMEIKVDEILGEIASHHGFHVEGIPRIRDKRVGASITGSSVRRGVRNNATLYESAVILRKA